MEEIQGRDPQGALEAQRPFLKGSQERGGLCWEPISGVQVEASCLRKLGWKYLSRLGKGWDQGEANEADFKEAFM